MPELPFGDPAKGDETLRRNSGVGDGGEAGTVGTAGRDWSLLGTKPEFVDRDKAPPETTLALGGDDDDEEEGTRLTGEFARAGTDGPPLLREGDAGRFAGGDVVRAAEVA